MGEEEKKEGWKSRGSESPPTEEEDKKKGWKSRGSESLRTNWKFMLD